MTVLIRPANAEDRGGCLELIESLTSQERKPEWGETYDRLVDGERGEILVAEEDGALLGVATVSYNLAIRYGGEYCQLEELIVSPRARGKNAGGLLVSTAVERARARGCGEMGLYLLVRTAGNQPFYEKYGFELVGSEMRQRLDLGRNEG